ncbi:malate dehydrogenase [Halarcobacter anaerophilus]|uniref:Malate dehydrogenase n=1 Tax=Halarcobacter anaerophilus TaxID=877500 RepID=A0A4Q0XWG1_9BACT|nr:malate dehydrogenase [Halarcobacter anaerophilus]QDF28737.1 malate dehydrogenase, NAD-dependent [Halarcobacter anaerophilus]RXJ61896.1 malate dehydrogenase [Halarcobacter anaerophilus]
MKKRVGVIGVGNVGATIAYNLALKESCDEILLKDIREDYTKAVALDISQASCAINSKTKIEEVSNNADFKECNIIVITAGIARKPGMSRDDLLLTNAEIMKNIIEEIAKLNKDAIIIIVSNPLDAMVYTALKISKFPRKRVLGMAGILDSARMSYFIQEKLGKKDIQALVLGGHGDEMVPLIDSTKADGISISKLLSQKQIDEIIEKTKNGGVEIVKLFKTGSAYYAPAHSTLLMIEAILNDEKKIYPCAVKLEGEYGFKDTVTGVPVVLGKNGVEKIVEYKLSLAEQKAFATSIKSVNTLINKVEKYIK